MTDVATGPADDRVQPRLAGLSPAVRWAISVGLTLALIAAMAWGTAQLLRDDATSAPGTASLSAELSQRRSVQLAASSFAANLTTYSVADVGGYQARLTPLMTTGFAKSFSLAVEGIVAEVRSTKMRSQGRVVQTAVSAVDAGSASALVVADVRVDSSLGDRVRHFRWKVTLVRQGGGWLVDGFEPVA
jgi:hypothetical protein